MTALGSSPICYDFDMFQEMQVTPQEQIDAGRVLEIMNPRIGRLGVRVQSQTRVARTARADHADRPHFFRGENR